MAEVNKKGDTEPSPPVPDNEPSTDMGFIDIPHTLSVRQLAELLDVSVVDVIKQLMKGGVMANINQVIDYDAASLVAANFGYKAQLQAKATRNAASVISEIKKQYSNTVKIGSIVFVSGQTPVDVYTARVETSVFEEQALVALNNLRYALEECGSFLDNLVKTRVLIPDSNNTASFRKVELQFYQKYAPRLVEEPPASTIIHPLALASPNFAIEIEAIAYIPDN